jgi:hypothetical protein
VFDLAEKTALQNLVNDVGPISAAISAGADGFFYLNDLWVSREFLDGLAEAFNHCTVVFLHGKHLQGGEGHVAKFGATLTEPERDFATLCLAILIAQGRVQMIIPRDFVGAA